MDGMAAVSLEEQPKRGGDRRFIVDEKNARHYERPDRRLIVRRKNSLDIGIW
jgi:hypothetical protein